MGTTENRKPGRPRDPELEARRKAQILDTAARVFAASGFANAQVQTIADELGVGNGTVYRYFPTKEQLFLSAVERGLKELDAEMDAVLARPLSGPALVRLAVRTYLAFFHRRREMAELFIQERAAFPHHHRPLYFVTKDDEAGRKHEAFFNRLVASGVIRPVPKERFFNVIGDLLYGTILTNLLADRPSDPDAQTDDVMDVILNGLLAKGGDER
jgi:AcrR family transcriptional regulator